MSNTAYTLLFILLSALTSNYKSLYSFKSDEILTSTDVYMESLGTMVLGFHQVFKLIYNAHEEEPYWNSILAYGKGCTHHST